MLRFHHIKSPMKRKSISAWAKELSLTGLSRPGSPGIVLVEGTESDISQYISWLKGLHWKKMQNVCEQKEALQGDSIDKLRRFSTFQEVQSESLGDILPLFESAGLADMFFAGTLPQVSK